MTSNPSDRATRLGVESTTIFRVRSGASTEVADEIAVEEPLQIRIDGDPWATTLRTPGSDSELVAGLLLAEGLIHTEKDVLGIVPCGRPGEPGFGNVVDVNLAPGAIQDHERSADGVRRSAFMSSACGVCGRAGIDDLLSRLAPLASEARFDSEWLLTLVHSLAGSQHNFARTGGLHGAGVAALGHAFDVVREDVGRHNAVDKVIGRLLLDGRLPAQACALVVSSRAGFEIVQKALTAGISALVCVSAPSSLAVRTAQRAGLLLLGFARNDGFNIYSGAERLITRPG